MVDPTVNLGPQKLYFSCRSNNCWVLVTGKYLAMFPVFLNANKQCFCRDLQKVLLIQSIPNKYLHISLDWATTTKTWLSWMPTSLKFLTLSQLRSLEPAPLHTHLHVSSFFRSRLV